MGKYILLVSRPNRFLSDLFFVPATTILFPPGTSGLSWQLYVALLAVVDSC